MKNEEQKKFGKAFTCTKRFAAILGFFYSKYFCRTYGGFAMQGL
jgi:hypothetical protein